MKVLIVLTSHDTLGDTGEKTGFWIEELAAPYYVFKDAGAEIALVSPAGGRPPIDPKSDAEDAQTDATRRFAEDAEAQRALDATGRLADVSPDDVDVLFYPGGHGPLWDLANDPDSTSLIEDIISAGRPVGLVCHAPGVLRDVKAGDGRALVAGKRVTGFSNAEEQAVGLEGVVPFLVQDVLIANGGRYEKGEDWASFVLADGLLVTGQNPASSAEAARVLLDVQATAAARSVAG